MADDPQGEKIQVIVEQKLAEGHRAVFVDGAFISATSSGCWHIAFYSEIPAMPESVVIEVGRGQATQLAPESHEHRGLREVQSTIILTPGAVISILEGLAPQVGYVVAPKPTEKQDG
jgi:hypothetical protein